MKIAIFGSGKAGKFLYEAINIYAKDIDIVAFIDNKESGKVGELHVFNPDKFFEKYKSDIDAIFLAAGAQKTVKLMIDTIKKYSKCDIYMLHDISGKNRINPFFENGQINSRYLRKVRFSSEKPTLPYFEVPITDKCNLNCKGCLFACNAIKGSEHVSKEQIIKDAKRMAELFYDVPWIRILGGEPLMHPDIEEILSEYRNIYPDSEIDLCTNGLLITKMNESFFKCLIDNNITIHVSGYKPTYNQLDKIDEKLKEYKLVYTLLKRDAFAKYYTNQPTNDAKHSFENCIASGCRELYRGRLIRCSAVIAFEKFNEQFNTSYITKENEDWFDIHKPDINAFELKEKIDACSNVCKYCDVDNMEEFSWDYAGNEAGLKDYTVD